MADAGILTSGAPGFERMRQDGPVALWGAASKAVAFSGLVGAAGLACAIDINPLKQGNFLPGSALHIVSPNRAASLGLRNIIVMNPVYIDEIRRMCAEEGIEGQLTAL